MRGIFPKQNTAAHALRQGEQFLKKSFFKQNGTSSKGRRIVTDPESQTEDLPFCFFCRFQRVCDPTRRCLPWLPLSRGTKAAGLPAGTCSQKAPEPVPAAQKDPAALYRFGRADRAAAPEHCGSGKAAQLRPNVSPRCGPKALEYRSPQMRGIASVPRRTAQGVCWSRSAGSDRMP